MAENKSTDEKTEEEKMQNEQEQAADQQKTVQETPKSEMVEFEEDDEDDLEPLIREFVESKDAIQSMLVMFRKLKQAGIVDFIDQISGDYLPSDVEFVGKFFSSREFTTGVLKSANTLLGLMYALSRDTTSDTLKALLFDSEGMVDSMVTGAKNPERLSMMRLFAMTKDPEIASGLTAVLNLLKELGKSLQKVQND